MAGRKKHSAEVTDRTTADVEADKAAREAARTDALAAKSDRTHSAADSAEAAHRRAVDMVPPGGEPIKIGHHSERRRRLRTDRAGAVMYITLVGGCI